MLRRQLPFMLSVLAMSVSCAGCAGRKADEVSVITPGSQDLAAQRIATDEEEWEFPDSVGADTKPAGSATGNVSQVSGDRGHFWQKFRMPSFSKPKGEERWLALTQGLPATVGYEEGLSKARANGQPIFFLVVKEDDDWTERFAMDCFTSAEVRPMIEAYNLVIIDAKEEPEAAVKLGLGSAFPLLVFCTSQGEQVAQQVGYIPPPKLIELMQRGMAANTAAMQARR